MQAEKWRKLPLSLAIMLSRPSAATGKTGKWPVHVEMPPETCNQATGQLWGSWGIYFSNSKGLLFYSVFLSFSFTFSVMHDGGGIFKPFSLDTKTIFRNAQKKFSSATPSFLLMHFFLFTAIMCVAESLLKWNLSQSWCSSSCVCFCVVVCLCVHASVIHRREHTSA